MLTQKNTNKDLTKSPSPANFKIPKIVIILFGIIAACVLILILLNVEGGKKEVEQKTIDDQIYSLSKKAKPSNFDLNQEKSSVLSQNVDEETGLPIVDQNELAKKYQTDLKEIMAALEQQIQLSGDAKSADVEAIKIIKKKAMSEVVPRQYKDLHIDFIRTLDLIIEGDIDGAMNKLEQIKNKL